ncbi:hypothetical protein LUZ60_004093 [Juncus effusus]|nr:hypothetical protein LUZ60_004093 [Juncus effusus]
MGEEVDMDREFRSIMADQLEDEEDDERGRVSEWEMGLPSCDDLTPLTQSLIPPELASAFQIPPEPGRSAMDVVRASHHTLSSLRRNPNSTSSSNFKPFAPFSSSSNTQDHTVSATVDDTDSALMMDDQDQDQDQSARALKRPRLVWTPQLHKRFVDVVSHLGLKNAVPKTIMQLMNVEGLTRENVASHLQKYRLYVKRMSGVSNEGPASPSDSNLFASTPVPPSFNREPSQVPVPMPYAIPAMYPMTVFGHNGMNGMNGMGMSHHHHHNGMNGMGMNMITGGSHGPGAYGPSASYTHHVNRSEK